MLAHRPLPCPIPFIVPRRKPERRLARKALTIVAGFHFADGVLLCADTEINESFAKYQASKIRGYAIGPAVPPDKIAFAMTGTVPVAERAIALCGEALSEKARVSPFEMTNDGIRQCIETQIGKFYREHIFTHPLYNTGHEREPNFDLLIAVWSHITGRTSLLATNEQMVNVVRNYECMGIGAYFARYVSQGLFRHHLTLNETALLAAHILQQTKNNVPGCGKRSEFLVIERGEMNQMPAMEVSLGEEYSDKYAPLMNSLLFALADENKDFDVTMFEFRALADGLREFYRVQRSGYRALQNFIKERRKQDQKQAEEFSDAARKLHRKDVPAAENPQTEKPDKPKRRRKR
jgi:20S proteasome alpha/beta subunit